MANHSRTNAEGAHPPRRRALVPLLAAVILAALPLPAQAEGLDRDAIISRLRPPLQLRNATAAPVPASTIDLAIPFEINAATLRPEGRRQLDQLAAAMASPALIGLAFEIAGHTDASGKPAANQRLSLQRAETVKTYLQQRGIGPDRLKTVGFGADRLKYPGQPNHPGNRRVQITVFGPTAESSTSAGAAAALPAPASAATAAVGITDCDRLAAWPDHPGRVAPGVPDPAFQAEPAVAACRTAVQEHPHIVRLQLQLARGLERLGHWQEMLSLQRAAAEAGDPWGQLLYSRHWWQGVATQPADPAQALRWLRRAAQQGLAEAENELGICYENGDGIAQDPAEAARWYQRAVQKDHPWAFYNLAGLYDQGLGVAREPVQAAALDRKAAEAGLAAGQHRLAMRYFDGNGVPRDAAQGLKWARAAAEQGHPNAQFALYLIYARGVGTAPDPAAALRWLKAAADQGDEEALKAVAGLSPAERQAMAFAEVNALSEQVVRLHREGRYGEAVELARRAVDITESTLGPDHPNLAVTLNTLTEVLRAAGRLGEIELPARRALALSERLRGPDHPDLVPPLNTLALTFHQLGRNAEAEPLFRRALALLTASLGPDHPNVALVTGNLAAVLAGLDQQTEAETLYQQVLANQEKRLGPDHPEVARSLNNLAAIYYQQARYGEAQPLQMRSLAIEEKARGAGHPEVGRALNNLAELQRSQGRDVEAEALFRRALEIRERALGPDHPDVAQTLNNLAELYRGQSRADLALPLFQRALAIREQALGPNHPDVAESLSNLGLLYRGLDQRDQADLWLRRALTIAESALGPDHVNVATVLNNLSSVAGSDDRPEEAEALLRRALAIQSTALGPDHPLVAITRNNLAKLHQRTHRLDEALAEIRDATAIVGRRSIRAGAGRSAAAGGEIEALRPILLTHLTLLADRLQERADAAPELTAESFEVGQLYRDGSVGAALAQMAARQAAGSGPLAALVRDRQDRLRAWQKAEADLVVAAGRPPAARSPKDEQALRDRRDAFVQELEALDRRLAQEFPAYVALTAPRPIPLARVQALLNPEEALVAFAINRPSRSRDGAGTGSGSGTGGERSFVWLVRPNSASVRTLPFGSSQLATRVDALRSRLSPDRNPNLAAFPPEAAHALFQDLIGPEAARLDGVKTLFVVADGALDRLPFSVLVTEAPAAVVDEPDYRRVAWLARRWATVSLPTVGALRALRELAGGSKAAEPFVGFGNPDFANPAGGSASVPAPGPGPTLELARGQVANPDELRAALSPLPETADELRLIATTLGASTASLYLGQNASVPTLRALDLSRYRVLGFATHALVSGEFRGLAEPAIALTPPAAASLSDDGLLRASQVAQLKLDADWVVLSACNTAAGAGNEAGSPGLSGLAKAFFYAGARAVLVSHWSVLSDATVPLTTGMFREWQAEPALGRAEALRRSMMALLDTPADDRFRHPMAWAPFVVAGEGGAKR